MKEHKLYVGELNDGPIDHAAKKLIQMAKETNNDVFLRWNGATMRVSSDSTVDSVLEDYDVKIHQQGLATDEKYGRIVKVEDLSRKIAEIIAKICNDED